MNRILYVMHVPWGWIKQRPHFIAENLSNDFFIDLKYRKSNSVSSYNLKKCHLDQKIKISGFRMIPFEKLPILKYFKMNWINKLLFKFSIYNINSYDYVWLTSPNLYNLLEDVKIKGKIIYDCMDDVLEFPFPKSNRLFYKKTFLAEMELIEKSSFIFCSSDYLKSVLIKRYKISNNIIVINNAINLYQNNPVNSDIYTEIEHKINSLENPFIYIGTISEWFDFDSVLELLNSRKDINIVLIGPILETKMPYHERLHLLGPVKHEYIFQIMEISKALIMPFKVNELINSVNPVKLYEYIFSGKPIISSHYKETEKFGDLVFLYENTDNFIEIAYNIIDGARKASPAEMKNFAIENTWAERHKQILKYLN